MPRSVALTKGYVAQVSTQDYRRVVAAGPWFANVQKDHIYAVRNIVISSGERRQQYLHRFILRVHNRATKVDHRDDDGLNCTRRNLRRCTHAQNLCNRGKNRNNTSGYKGVTWDKVNKKWRAQVMHLGKSYSMGRFPSKRDAILAAVSGERQLHGGFAPAPGREL